MVDVRILVAHALRLTRVQLITQTHRILSAEEKHAITLLLDRRLAGEPVAYIVGEREFFGLSFTTTPDVLIPRPETEHLVELALERAAPNARVLDLGTGSGAIAISLAHTRPDLDVHAVDISASALAIAQTNAQRHAVKIHFALGSWFEAMSNQQFDLIVSNPPYIVANDPHLSQHDLRFEPVDALTDHADGLSAYRAIIRGAPDHLVAGGWLLFEHGYDQAAAVRALMEQTDFHDVSSWCDLAGIERVTAGRLK